MVAFWKGKASLELRRFARNSGAKDDGRVVLEGVSQAAVFSTLDNDLVIQE
jgi:hypothetical protein